MGMNDERPAAWAEPESADLEEELDFLLARAGLVLGADRRLAMFSCLVEVRRWGALIRSTKFVPGDEPANVYDIRTTTDHASRSDGLFGR